MTTKNKGEWSEFYVFLKLLGDGILYAADSKLNKIENIYYPLVEILRNENNNIKHYRYNDKNIKIFDDKNELLLNLPASEFESKAQVLLTAIKTCGSTFSVPEIEKFMEIIKCVKVKADSTDKSDITLVLHDCKTYRDETFGFSIKSNVGNPPTLFNSGKPTNFTFKIIGNLTRNEIDKINAINTKSKIKDRINAIYKQGCSLQFEILEHNICNGNLQMIDSNFPKIMANYVLLYYSGVGKFVYELTNSVNELNPCGYDLSTGQMFYEHKIKDFLTNIALGMKPATVWNGNYDATGGYIVVKDDGEILCYHIYNHNEFRNYMLENTRLDTPSTSKYDFGYIYQKDNKNYIKLNLQIRFI